MQKSISKKRFVLLALLLTAGFCSYGLANELVFATKPAIITNPNPRAPLVALVNFSVAQPVSTLIELDDGERSWSIKFDQTHDPEQGLAILGMKPDRKHELRITISNGVGEASLPVMLEYQTPPLPNGFGNFAPIKVKTAKPELMEPGYTFLSVRRRVPGRSLWITKAQRKFMTSWGLIVALDNSGEVVWYYEADTRISGIDRLQNGHLLFHLTDFRTVELDMLGNKVREWYAADRPSGPAKDAIPIVGAQTLHHQPLEMPSGNFMSFSANARQVKDYYTSETDVDAPRKDQKVMGDSVIEFGREGNIVWRWNAWDHLDPYRVGYDFLDPYWHVRGFPEHADWTHGNGLAYDERDDSIIVNFKHQDALFKIDRASGDIKWILGQNTDWPDDLKSKVLQPKGDEFRWIFHAHNPRITKAGTIIIYDNGTFQARPFEQVLKPHETFSRAVEYEVDEDNMTVRQVWASHSEVGPDTCVTPAMGDAHSMPVTDNVFVVDSICGHPADDLSWDPWDFSKRHIFDVIHWARIREYRRSGDASEIVFDVEIHDPNEVLQWEVFGGFRTPDLYPAR